MEEGRGMLEGVTTTVTPSNLCAHVNSLRWHSHNRHLEPGVCVLMSMLGGGATTISTLRGCAHVNAWRWHSDNLHLELCVCAYVTAYTHLETCVLMSKLGGGTATISMYS